MADLADLIGQLAASFIRGRLQADLEAIRVAELYSSHPLLKHFPIPRFRLPDVDLEVPLSIDEVPGASPSSSGTGGLSPQDVKSEIPKALDSQLAAHGISLSPQRRSQIEAELASAIDRVERTEAVAVDVLELSRIVRNRLTEVTEGESEFAAIGAREFARRVGQRLNVQLLNRRPLPPGLRVTAETSRLKETSRDAEIVRLRMKLTEDAVEWTVVETEGGESDRLIPE